MKRRLLDVLIEELNQNRSEDEKLKLLRTKPKMECGDGKWRDLDGKFTK